MCFVNVAAFASALPFQQARRDELRCGALCLGSMTSVRSALSLVGAPVVGRLSDRLGRRFGMVLAAVATVTSAVMAAWAPSMWWIWVALVPTALCGHQFDLLKTAIADAYEDGRDDNNDENNDDAQVAGAQGTLGAAAGLGFLGVALGGFFATPAKATAVALFSFAATLAGTLALPPKSRATAPTNSPPTKGGGDDDETSWVAAAVRTVRTMASLPSARSPPGVLLLSLRLLMGFAFHVFMAIWQTSLKARFPAFGPGDQAKFMTMVGLGYALSQGMARPILATAERRRATPALLVACCATLSLGRVAAIQAPEVRLVYAAYAPVIAALGVMNAALTGAAGKVAPPNERGGFMGLLSATEAVCGIFGPVLGGLLSLHGQHAVLALVLSLYVLAAAAIFNFWRPLVIGDAAKKTDGREQQHQQGPTELKKASSTWMPPPLYTLGLLGLLGAAAAACCLAMNRPPPPPVRIPDPPRAPLKALVATVSKVAARIPFLPRRRQGQGPE